MASSKVPSSGGQYYYVSACASPPVSKPLSYLVGWLGVIGWQAYGTAICYGAATMGQGLYAFNHPDYVAEPWHGWLGTLAVLALAILVNISVHHKAALSGGHHDAHQGHKHYRHVVVIVVVSSHASVGMVTSHHGSGGWPDALTSSFVGLPNFLFAMVGLDSIALLNLPRLTKSVRLAHPKAGALSL